MNIHESAEDYLEAILRLKEAKGYARSVDISLLLGVTKPSVSVAMKRLRENGYLTMDADNLITLTPAGMEIARSIYDRHKTLSSFLESLGVDSDVAREDACKIEHDISEESFTAIRKLMQEREQEQKGKTAASNLLCLIYLKHDVLEEYYGCKIHVCERSIASGAKQISCCKSTNTA